MNPIENKSEKPIKLTAKLYDCRNRCKKLFGAEWKKRIAKHTILIHAAMKTHKIDNEIEAAMKLIEECQDIDDTGIFTMNVLAAVVELVEPTCDHPYESTETTFGGGVRCTKCNTILN